MIVLVLLILSLFACIKSQRRPEPLNQIPIKRVVTDTPNKVLVDTLFR
jgi:hypothetical protein